MKYLYVALLIVFTIVNSSEVPNEKENLESTIRRIIQESKNDSLVVSGKEGTPENIDTPKYVREFGSNLEKFVKDLNVEKFIADVDAKIDESTRSRLEKMMLDLAKEEIELKQEEKDEATRVVSVTAKKMTPAEITEEAKKRVEGLTAIGFVSKLISKMTEGDDRMIHVYYCYALKMLEEVMVNTSSAMSLHNIDNVKRLAKCKTMVEDVVKGSAPFYKTAWFITTMVLFSIMVVGVAVFVFLVIRKGNSGSNTTNIK